MALIRKANLKGVVVNGISVPTITTLEESRDFIGELIFNMLPHDTKDMPYDTFMRQMKSKIGSKVAKYGDSWRSCKIQFLRERLSEEFCEWLDVVERGNMVKESNELIDIANLCIMIWARLREKRSKAFTRAVKEITDDPNFEESAMKSGQSPLFDEPIGVDAVE